MNIYHKILQVKRVSYGRDDTSIEMREYVSPFSSAVGSILDWMTFAKDHGFGRVNFTEKNGTKWEQFVF